MNYKNVYVYLKDQKEPDYFPAMHRIAPAIKYEGSFAIVHDINHNITSYPMDRILKIEQK